MKEAKTIKSLEKNTDAYIKEYYDTINQIWKDNPKITELKYFLKTMLFWCDTEHKKSADTRVVVLGTSIPEELIMASGAKPYFIIGGSLGSVSWSDDLVPRDTDPVSRSILGYIHQPNGADFSDSLFIVPLISDSMRKIVYELKEEGRKVFAVDIPPCKKDQNAEKKWQMQMISMTNAISAHLKTIVTKHSINTAVKSVSMARHTLLDFLKATQNRNDIITDTARQLVQNSYYFADDIDIWTAHLKSLINQTKNMPIKKSSSESCGVLLLGSPVIFPNYKIPFLINNIQLTIMDAVDSSSLKNHIVYERKSMYGSCNRAIRNIASQWYKYDASSAFVKNDLLYKYVSWLIKRGNIEGVIYHVLKGQIEYDFELEHFEKMLSEYNIPVFRLETDYQYQDVEQLRIRTEAFSEMLFQNRYKRNRTVQFKTDESAVKEARAVS